MSNDLFQGMLKAAPWHYMPALLNFHGVSASQLVGMRIADKPALVYALLVAFLPECGRQDLLPRLRRVLRSRPASGKALLDPALASHFHGWVRRQAEEARLYDSQGQVKSEICATFSYDTCEMYEEALALHVEVKCPACGATEIAFDDGDVLLQLRDFDHLTGPYCRCRQCDAVVRPEIDEATCLPQHYYDDDRDSWDNYVEWLGEIVEQLAAHVGANHGRPDGLYLGGRNLDWRGRGGYTTVDLSGEALAEAMSVRGDFSITDGKLWLRADGTAEITCVMPHHDAVSSFTVEPFWWCELGDDEIVTQEALAGNAERVSIASTVLCGRGDRFPAPPGAKFSVVSRAGLAETLRWMARQCGFERWETADPEVGDALNCSVAWVMERFISDLEAGHDARCAMDAPHLRALIDAAMGEAATEQQEKCA